MDEDQLTEIIINTKKWFDCKVEELKRLINAPENIKIHFENDNEQTVELPKKSRKDFMAGISVALEVIGKFPVNITETNNSDDD
ncbi:hypothetical protein [Chryseobacterium cucumeris]|uniref:hypothetical protein n=1 Tax=Chryseobacterium cucumeris TaxID=1813611 RepID=UPI0037C00539